MLIKISGRTGEVKLYAHARTCLDARIVARSLRIASDVRFLNSCSYQRPSSVFRNAPFLVRFWPLGFGTEVNAKAKTPALFLDDDRLRGGHYTYAMHGED